MSVSVVVNTHGLAEAVAQLNRLTSWKVEDGARHIAPILESQTLRRVDVEKRSPRGEAWKPNRTGTSILRRTGRHLRDSIAGRAAGADAIVEAHWEHAHVHQTGMDIHPRNGKALVFRVGANAQPIFARKVTIPKREFIGLSRDNEAEIVEELNAMLDSLGGAQ
ncbi:hypothetical protein AFEL58S_01997 [Afipia felis]